MPYTVRKPGASRHFSSTRAKSRPSKQEKAQEPRSDRTLSSTSAISGASTSDASRKNDRLPSVEVVYDKGPANCLCNLGPAVE